MRCLLTLLLASAGGSAMAQLYISNHVAAEASVTFNSDSDTVGGSDEWDARGRISEVAVNADGGMGGGVNVASAWQRFEEPLYGDVALRTRCFVRRTSGGGDAPLYEASAQFESNHHLVVETGGTYGGTLSLRLIVPMHGLLAANFENRGYEGRAQIYVYSLTSIAHPRSAPFISTLGDINLSSDADHVFHWGSENAWYGHAYEADVRVEDGVTSEIWRGAELNSYRILDMGTVATQSSVEFDVATTMHVSARIGEGEGEFALADFSGTGGYEIQAFDAAGNRFTDFNVRPVPEPASFAALALGLVALRRRASTPLSPPGERGKG